MPASPTRRTSWAEPPQARSRLSSRRAELGVASDQRRVEAERFKPACRARRLELSGQPMHQDAAGLAAQRDVAQRFIGESVPGQSMGERPDQDLAGRRHRLQALRGVHRVAGDRIGFGIADAETAGHHRPGVARRYAASSGSPATACERSPRSRGARRSCRARRAAPVRDRPHARPARRTARAAHRR